MVFVGRPSFGSAGTRLVKPIAEYTVLLTIIFVFSCAKMTPPLFPTASLAPVWSGCQCVLISVLMRVLFVAAFKKGGELATLYPIYATTFIFAALIALWAYGTPIKPVNIGGMFLLVAGMYFMGR